MVRLSNEPNPQTGSSKRVAPPKSINPEGYTLGGLSSSKLNQFTSIKNENKPFPNFGIPKSQNRSNLSKQSPSKRYSQTQENTDIYNKFRRREELLNRIRQKQGCDRKDRISLLEHHLNSVLNLQKAYRSQNLQDYNEAERKDHQKMIRNFAIRAQVFRDLIREHKSKLSL